MTEQSPRVLLIEDGEDAIWTLTHNILKEFSPIVVLRRLDEALSRIKQMAQEGNTIKVVLLDGNLDQSKNNRDGEQILETIHSHHELDGWFVIATASMGGIEGADEHIKKFDKKKMTCVIRAVLEGKLCSQRSQT